MARRLILDTGILIARERGRAVDAIDQDDDVVMAAITLGELWTGADLAIDDARRSARQAHVERVREIVPVVPYDDGVARAHGVLLAHVQRSGRPRGAHDLIIAATAVATSRILLTTDRSARFDELPSVTVEHVG